MTPPLKPTLAKVTGERQDRINTLPVELQRVIFGYLLPSHRPDQGLQPELLISKKPPHALYQLAATCRSLDQQLQSWAQHWLKSHAAITKYKQSRDTQPGRRFLTGKHGLLFWIKRRCVFCGKQTHRSAILANGLRCCIVCDQEQWPDKITKTKAKEEYNLRDHHLLPRYYHHPSYAKLAKLGITSGIIEPRYGTCQVANVMTTMFLLSDVQRLAEAIHGNFEMHLARRKREAKLDAQDREETGAGVEGAGTGLDASMTQAEVTVDELVVENEPVSFHLGA
ncbi:hypothetical protein LTR35_011591 [Friedmanniomyces endolithicus]|uniref:F-box domain-containing protein n=1 Tax=Friedmanniomyces endolithicus TaxID=329885 RepID=A0AAN6FJC6_9PEZI|nr:hypothetical protein LTR35_011591 [Friedmanniomyces endolithicus]KAK0287725.1 hypothetical protein LTS00_009837 [Friedmanniomyces endolithicus]KAK0318548.1 hypothetical protein LTR82_010610 [Friedmanniomyces endolithicus]KAK0994601.1 hypothetical protein LTR54_010698 [Friedmanniomyces endolithicus]